MNFSCSYNYALVALSVLIAMFASYAALDLAGRVTAAGGWTRAVWLLGGAGAMGIGIWSMHYIGMLACMLPVPVAYHWPTVLLSLFAAILASVIALYVVSRQKMGAFQAFAGSVLMGGGIASMHYIGMAAMRLPATRRYDSFLVVLSVVFAVLISLAALWITFHFRDEKAEIGWRKTAGAVLMGAGIASMHYIGMAAASFTPSGIPADLSHAVSISTLSIAGIAAATLIVLGLALLTSWVDRRFAAQALELQEEKLHQSEAYLSEAQQLSHTGSFGWRISSGEITWSEETFRIFQYDRTTKPTVELLLQRVHPEDAALVKQTIERASQDGKDFDFEHRLLMRDGSVKHLDVVAHAEKDKSGELEFVGAVMDITERKQAEEKLRRSEGFLAEGQRISHTGSWSWNVASGKVAWSEEHYRIFGFEPEKTEPSFQLFLDTVHPEDRSFIKRSLDEAVRERSGFDLEFRIALADGSIKYVQGVGRPAFGASGEVDRYIGTTVDLTERKRAEEALKESEERYRVLVELSPNSICVHRDGELLYVNPAGVRLFGATDYAQLVGRSVLDFIHPDSLPIVRERMRQVRAGETVPLIEEKFVTLNGEVRDVEVTSIPIIYERAQAAQVIIRDITERKQAEEKLRASEQVARGQVEALTYSLDVLATAPAPDKFIGQMLGTIGRLLGSQSVILWLLDESTDSLVLRAWAEGTNFAKADPGHPFIKNPSSWKEDPGLREMFFSGAPVACEDVEQDPYTSSELREYLKSGGTKKFLRIPTLVGGRVRGFIGIRHGDRLPYRPEEIELAQALSHQAMLAIQLNEFAEQSRQAAILEERNRMARDIHDTLAQGFTGVIVQLEAAEDAISCRCRKEADIHLHRAADLARRSLSEARRSVHALRPRALQEHNFWEALKGIIKNTTVGTALRTRFQAQGRLPELPQLWQENLLHIGEEALTNTLKYARARNFETRVSYKARELRLELRDDGNGFKVQGQNDGMGLTGMRERVEQMGGTLQVTSARGKGTKIVVTLPYNPDAGSPRNDSLVRRRSFSSRRSVAEANGERQRTVETLHP